MKNFEYRCPTRVVFGKNGIEKLDEILPAEERVFVTYGQGSIKRNGVYDRVVKALGARMVGEFGGIEANPDHETCVKAMAAANAAKPTLLLAVGGGSVVDATKYIVCGMNWTKTADPWDIPLRWGEGADKAYEPAPAVPLACVLTLPATGTEMNNGGVISWRAKNMKLGFGHPGCFPKFSILDPEITYSLPRRQLANGLADAFVHVMEQYAGHHDQGILQDEQAEALMRTLVRIAPDTLVMDPPKYQSRAEFFWTTTQCLNYLIACGVDQCWGTHIIGHELTAFYGLDHGVTLSIVMPRFLRKLKVERRIQLERLAKHVFGITAADDPAQAAIDACEKWFQSLGIATTLSGNGCDGSHIDEIAAKFEGRTLGPEKKIGPKEIAEILRESL